MLSKPKLTWFEHGDSIAVGSRKEKKGPGRHVWVNLWNFNGNFNEYNLKSGNVPLNKTPWYSLQELKEVLVKKLQWYVGALSFQKVKTFAISKNTDPGWCLFAKDGERENQYHNGADFSYFNPVTMEMEEHAKNTYLMVLASKITAADSGNTKNVYAVVDQHKETILERGIWIVVDENSGQFAKCADNAALRNFKEWLSNPPVQRVKKVFYGPYWPFVAFYYDCHWVQPQEIQKVFQFMKLKGILTKSSDNKETGV